MKKLFILPFLLSLDCCLASSHVSGICLSNSVCKTYNKEVRQEKYLFICNETNIGILAECIFKAENSLTYPYGIKIAIPNEKNKYKHYTKEAARKICCNTTRNNYDRWCSSGKKETFIAYLGNKYCPSASDKQGNLNWIKNVTLLYFKK